MRKSLLLIMFLMAWLGTNAYAAKLPDLYQVELPMVSQAEAEKSKVIHAGLMQMLVKLSGDPQVGNKPSLKEALKKPDSYVQEFSYVNTPDMAHPYLLRIQFNQADVDNLLKTANVAYWGESRPQLLVWLAVTHPLQPTVILSNDTGGALVAA